MELEAARGVPYHRPMLRAVQLFPEVYAMAPAEEEEDDDVMNSTVFTKLSISGTHQTSIGHYFSLEIDAG